MQVETEITCQVFLYGGSKPGSDDKVQSQANVELDQLYVLSIPSFSWHKSSHTPNDARSLMTCHVAGNRQMVMIGWEPPGIHIEYWPTDPWPQGLGIVDLTDMQWKSSFDADAAPYETPKQVKDYIAKNGMYPQEWDNEVIKQWIIGRGRV